MLNLENEKNEKNEMIYSYYRLPKKASLLLNGNERCVLGILIDNQQMTKETECEVSISYLCKNLNVTDKTMQGIIKKLVQLEFITKQSGYTNRKKNIYSVNFDKILQYDKMKSEVLFKMRVDQAKPKTKSEKKVIETNQSDQTDCEIIQETKDIPVFDDEKDAESLIKEFETYLNEDDPKVAISTKVLEIIPNKYNNQEKAILRMHVSSPNLGKWQLREPLLKVLA